MMYLINSTNINRRLSVFTYSLDLIVFNFYTTHKVCTVKFQVEYSNNVLFIKFSEI